MVTHWFDLIWNKLTGWGVALVKMLPNLVLAIIVMIAFIIVARLVRKATVRIVHQLSGSESVSGLTSAIAYTLTIMLGLMISLKVLNLEQAVTSLLAGVGIIGLALGFAFQDLTSNFISGAFIVFKRPFDVGHTVETNGFVGTIQDIQLRATTMQTLAGLHVIIPNKDVFQKPIINYTLTTSRRVELDFIVPNPLPLEQVSAALVESVRSVDHLDPSKEPEAYFTIVDDTKLKLYVSFWTTDTEPDLFLKSKHDGVVAISEALKRFNVPKA